jgi:hypothetical protein
MESVAPRNLLLEDVQYVFDETSWGTWRRFVYPNGQRFEEFRSHRDWAGMPLLHYTYGVCPETGRRIMAKGVIAIGRTARGIIAIGHASIGLVAIGQLAVGLLLGLGQAATGAFCLGQLALGILVGVGQFSTGQIAIGQVAVGTYVLAQLGWGDHVVDTRGIDPIAKDFFLRFIGK